MNLSQLRYWRGEIATSIMSTLDNPEIMTDECEEELDAFDAICDLAEIYMISQESPTGNNQ